MRESDKWKVARALARENLARQMGDVKSMFTHPRWRAHTLVAGGHAPGGGRWGGGGGGLLPGTHQSAPRRPGVSGLPPPPGNAPKNCTEINGGAHVRGHGDDRRELDSRSVSPDWRG